MTKAVITGANGFIGKNLRVQLGDEYEIIGIGRSHTDDDLQNALTDADAVFHLAGINRPQNPSEFQTGNVGFTEKLCQMMRATGRPIPIIFSSSTQAARDNLYGNSKRNAEAVIADYAAQSGATAHIFRLTNVFGKWCRPNYNSAVATFCHNIARGLPITISNRENSLSLIYIDDVIASFMRALGDETAKGVCFPEATPTHPTTLGELVDTLYAIRNSRESLRVADLSDPLIHKLYATFLSYLPKDEFAYDLQQRVDPRGSLAEFVKSEPFGQIFVSRTVPGITRGNHFHHLKTEKFLVLEGDAIIRFRHILSDEVIEYAVKGSDYRVLDIPPGYTHSIENVGSGELVTLFWASEIFNPDRPDTTYLTV